MPPSVQVFGVLAGIFFSAVPLPATTYFVAPDGNNSANGLAEDAPLATPQAAIEKAVPGDTILLRGGLYANGAGGMKFDAAKHRGSDKAWLTIKAFPGEQPVLRWSRDTAHFVGIWLTDAAYVEISGLTLEGWMDELTLAEAKADAKAQKGSVTFNAGGIQADGRNTKKVIRTDANRPHHFRIIGNTIRKFPGGGISFIQCDYLLVQGNTVEDCCWYSIWAGSGISIWQAWNLDSTTDNYRIRVIGNRLFGNKTLVEWASIGALSDGNGIIIDDFRNTQNKSPRGAYAGRTLVANNLSVNNGGSGIHSFLSDNVDIVHNTAYHNGQVLDYGEIFALDSGNVRVVNNICVARSDRAINKLSKTCTNVDYRGNLYCGGYVNASHYADNNPTGEPVFLSPSIDPATADFRLGAGSPAIDAALTGQGGVAYPWVAELTADITGRPRSRGSGPDLGAYESESPPLPAPTANPTSPTVVLTAPMTGATLTPGIATTLTATASDSGGTISKVEFYRNGVLLGTATAAPYALTWTPLSYGSTTVYAKAYDASGVEATSNQIPVTIVRPAIPTSGQLADWSFDEGNGSASADHSGNNHPASIENATWASAGRFGGAIACNGAPTTPVTFDHPALGAFSFSAWVNGSAGGAQNPVILSLPGQGSNGANGYTLSLRRGRSTDIHIGGVSFNDGTGGDWQSWGKLEAGTWYHLVVTFDGAANSTGLMIYVNGVARPDTKNYGSFNGQLPSVISSTEALKGHLGNRPDKTRPLAGSIDQVRLYDRVLTPTEVIALYLDDGGAAASPR